MQTAAEGVSKVYRLSKGTPNKDLRMSNENEKLREEIKELHNMVDDLTAWNEGVEADNDTLRKEIARLKEERNEVVDANANNQEFRTTDMS